jgi:hypothetical protein
MHFKYLLGFYSSTQCYDSDFGRAETCDHPVHRLPSTVKHHRTRLPGSHNHLLWSARSSCNHRRFRCHKTCCFTIFFIIFHLTLSRDEHNSHLHDIQTSCLYLRRTYETRVLWKLKHWYENWNGFRAALLRTECCAPAIALIISASSFLHSVWMCRLLLEIWATFRNTNNTQKMYSWDWSASVSFSVVHAAEWQVKTLHVRHPERRDNVCVCVFLFLSVLIYLDFLSPLIVAFFKILIDKTNFVSLLHPIKHLSQHKRFVGM